MISPNPTSFALSLSKGRPFLQEEQGFDKLSPNGVFIIEVMS
jgi:hypothetical protein